MRILVCGGRDFKDRDLLYKTMLPYMNEEDLTIIHGAASGADSLARIWAEAFAHKVESYPADWNKYGKRAGYIRNTQMLNEGKPDLVIAFPGGKGTQMMINLAEAAKVPAIKVQ
jgi:hypothetical protein